MFLLRHCVYSNIATPIRMAHVYKPLYSMKIIRYIQTYNDYHKEFDVIGNIKHEI